MLEEFCTESIQVKPTTFSGNFCINHQAITDITCTCLRRTGAFRYLTRKCRLLNYYSRPRSRQRQRRLLCFGCVIFSVHRFFDVRGPIFAKLPHEYDAVGQLCSGVQWCGNAWERRSRRYFCVGLGTAFPQTFLYQWERRFHSQRLYSNCDSQNHPKRASAMIVITCN